MTTKQDLLDRAVALVDEELLEGYWEAVEQLRTTDLVMVLVLDDDEGDVLKACTREAILNSKDSPEELLRRVAAPASSNAFPDVGFWLFTAFPEGELVCLNVNATFMSQGGSA